MKNNEKLCVLSKQYSIFLNGQKKSHRLSYQSVLPLSGTNDADFLFHNVNFLYWADHVNRIFNFKLVFIQQGTGSQIEDFHYMQQIDTNSFALLDCDKKNNLVGQLQVYCSTCASFRCVTSVELESISLLKLQSLLQMPWLVVVWTIVTLCSEVCPVSISTNCKVFRTPWLVLLQIMESMLMLHPFYRNSTGCLLGTVAFSKLQHLCINFCIVVLLLISNRSCLLAVVPIVLDIVTQIVNTLQFLLSIHQSSSQPNISAIVLPLMLLRSGMTSLKMFAVQHQLPPLERSLKHTCLQKLTHHSLPVTSVSPWYDPAMSLD